MCKEMGVGVERDSLWIDLDSIGDFPSQVDLWPFGAWPFQAPACRLYTYFLFLLEFVLYL